MKKLVKIYANIPVDLADKLQKISDFEKRPKSYTKLKIYTLIYFVWYMGSPQGGAAVVGRKNKKYIKLNIFSLIYYITKALQQFIDERLENALLAKIGAESYKEYLESGEGIPYDQIRKELKLN